MTATGLAERAVYDASTDFRPAASETPEWSPARRVGFRFLFAYFGLYLFPFPLGTIPFTGKVAGWLTAWDEPLGRWTETHLFGLAKPVPVVPTGSGDTMMNYAGMVDTLLIALAITLVWSALDRRRGSYARLYDWLRVYVRYGLATILFGYGFAKVIQSQFPPPTPDRFIEPLGQLSPMGLLWTFMGYSPAYNLFTGLGEVLGALFTAIRRTATAGALLLIVVMSNVVILNFTYDVPVKLFSVNLLLMAVFIAAGDARRLVNLFVLNRDAPRRAERQLFANARANRFAAAAGLVLIIFVMGRNYVGVRSGHAQTMASVQSPFYGAYRVEELRRNGQPVPLLTSDSTQWSHVAFSLFNRFTVRLTTDSLIRYVAAVDTTKKELKLTSRFQPNIETVFAYQFADAQQLVLAGHMGTDSLWVRLRRIDQRHMLLPSREFTWIQELPFNR
jgi:hypothetical protein